MTTTSRQTAWLSAVLVALPSLHPPVVGVLRSADASVDWFLLAKNRAEAEAARLWATASPEQRRQWAERLDADDTHCRVSRLAEHAQCFMRHPNATPQNDEDTLLRIVTALYGVADTPDMLKLAIDWFHDYWVQSANF